ncbi:MAG: Spy/CpxP family protein refolding chaperone [Candidatus Sericytochromatia bacterium]
MRKQLSQLALSALMVLGAASAPAFAQTPPQQPAAAPAGPIDYNKLHLTPEQVKKLNILRLEYNKQAITLKAQIQLKQLDIQKQLMSPAANPSLVRKLMQEKLTLEAKLQKSSLEQFLAFKKMLTPEQLVKLPGAMTIR